MEVNFSKLGIFQRYKPEIVKINLRSRHPPLYTFIRFWGRLPDYLLDDLMNLFRDKNKDVLFDPFGGSGSVIFKGMTAGFSKIIYNDINPAFTFITTSILRGLHIPRDSLEEHMNKLKQQLLSSRILLDLSKVNEKTSFIYKIAYNQQIILNKEKEKIDLRLKKKELNEVAKVIIRVLRYKKTTTFSSLREKTFKYLKNYSKLKSRTLFSFVLNRLIQKGVVGKEIRRDYFILSSSIDSPRDVKLLKIDENLDKLFEKKEKKYRHVIEESVFSHVLQYPNGKHYKKAEGAKTIGDLYSNWSKIMLSLIWKKIEEFPVQNSDITNVLKVCFLASLYDSSLMQMPHKSGWIIKSFWIPYPCGTKNPLYVFIKKMKHFLSVYDSLRSQIKEQTEIQIFNKDILDFTGRELKDKPDLVITHPPYFSTIQYGELSTIWSSWLNCKIPFEKEIIQNQQQGKSRDVYLSLLRKALEKISFLSRKDADIILIFQSKNQRDWELLDKVLLDAPLELKQIRCYRRNSWWGSKHIFNVGDFDYVFIFKNKGGEKCQEP